MNYVAEEIRNILDDPEHSLVHYGMPRRSGRYPWGSGDDPYQRTNDVLGRIEALKAKGWTETPENIKAEFGMSTSQYRIEKSLALSARRTLQVAKAKSLKDDGLGATEIGRKMGLPESTVRSLLNPKSEEKMNRAQKTADFIKEQIDKKGMIDVGVGVNREINVSEETMHQALSILQAQGYPVYGGRVEQATNKGKMTTMKVVCPKGTEHKEIFEYDKINSLNDYVSHDGGNTFNTFVYPKSMSSKRLKVLLKDEVGPDGETGVDKDGIIQIRRGVPDLSLGNDHYSQVRILVDDNKYLKGMAVYSDNLPKGVDVLFNSNKTSVEKALKDIDTKDPSNPFGTTIKAGGQSYYIDKNGKKQLSLINKRAEEGDWSDWSNALPSQFLSKQSVSLAKKQLNLAIADKKDEYDSIKSLTNPTIKKYYLDKFAEDCDSSSVSLKAAALPKQKYHVIIPINSLKENEVYAPNYKDGTKLALVRYPHGGTFEIPILTVNNKNKAGREVIGTDAIDAVGINKKNAERLSGADFDGDTVMCIPTHDRSGKVKIASRDPLKGLEGFEPKDAYPEVEGMTYMSKKQTQRQMGEISNLITDMTIKGASDDELAAAVRHSMVVIDAAKHKLNYKQSEIDNNISALKKEYQEGGASTIISRAKSPERVAKRQGNPHVNIKGTKWYDPEKPEGALLYSLAEDAVYSKKKVNKRTGEVTVVEKIRTENSSKMAETDDARKLMSDASTTMEKLYADYANTMKSLANDARKESYMTPNLKYSSEARKAYSKEVSSLNMKLNDALKNAPKERLAQYRAASDIENYKKSHPEATNDEIKKKSQQFITARRAEVGSIKRSERSIKIDDNEWKAIQSGAVTENVLKKILNNADADSLRSRAMPKQSSTLSSVKIARIEAYRNSNYTIAEIAEKMGLSASTVSKYLKGV